MMNVNWDIITAQLRGTLICYEISFESVRIGVCIALDMDFIFEQYSDLEKFPTTSPMSEEAVTHLMHV